MKIKDELAILASDCLVLDAGLGAPKFPLPPQKARDRYKREIDVAHGYGDRRGSQETRKAVAKWYGDIYGAEVDPESEVRITDGSREICFYVLNHLFRLNGRNKTVALACPFYGGHNTAISKAGGKAKFLRSDSGHSFFDSLETALAEGLRPSVVIVSYVSNPTGLKCTLSDLTRLAILAEKYDFYIISDAAYSELVYEGQQCPSVYQVPALRSRILYESRTPSKMFNAAQWRTGICVGNAELLQGMLEEKSDLNEGVNTPAQLALATALTECREYLPDLRHTYQTRAEYAVNFLRGIGWTNATMPDGGMFLWLPVPENIAQQGVGSEEFCKRLAASGVIMWPDTIFGGKGTHMRFCLREENSVVAKAICSIEDCIAALSSAEALSA